MLVEPRAQASEKIQARIEKGYEIKRQIPRIDTQPILSLARAEFDKWTSYNKELLRRLFDNTSIAEEYDYSGIRAGISNPPLALLKEALEDDVTERLTRLESIRDRLELIPEAKEKSSLQPTTWGQAVFIVHGHDESARETVARFFEKLGLRAIILHEQASKGMTLIQKFEKNAKTAGFAVVLLTPDDIGYQKP
jgi:hypothetical protein